MKILVFADIHYEDRYLVSALNSNRDAEYVLFLGDGLDALERVAENYPTMGFIAVRGNSDFTYTLSRFRDVPYTRTVNLDGVKIFMCHGHSVTLNVQTLGTLASANGADLALFGHTHKCFNGEFDIGGGKKVTIFNPGSIGEPRYDKVYSYGVIMTDNGKFEIRHESAKC